MVSTMNFHTQLEHLPTAQIVTGMSGFYLIFAPNYTLDKLTQVVQSQSAENCALYNGHRYFFKLQALIPFS